METKVCTDCGLEKPISEFYRDYRQKGVIRYVAKCKNCKNKDACAWSKRNPERIAIYAERGRVAKNEKSRELYRKKILNNPNYSRDKSTKFRARHKSTGNRTSFGRLSSSEWNQILDKYGGVCLSCGSVDMITVDHIVPLTLGGLNVASNVQPLCMSCNSEKGWSRIIDYRPDRKSMPDLNPPNLIDVQMMFYYQEDSRIGRRYRREFILRLRTTEQAISV